MMASPWLTGTSSHGPGRPVELARGTHACLLPPGSCAVVDL